MDEETSLHFSDLQRGQLLWIVDNSSLPWIGSYEFLRSQSFSQIILLTVIDSTTGQTLGECSETSDEVFHWTLFQWILNSDSLLCTTLPSNSSRVLFPQSTGLRTFSVALHADRGPVCLRDLRVHDERSIGCPPHLTGNSFKSQFVNCSCSFDVANKDGVSKDPQFPLFELVGTRPPSQTLDLSLRTIGSCDDFICLNNGTCFVDEKGSATCFCQNGFIGTACEVDLCYSLPCQNGGYCQANGGEPYCECTPTFTGSWCESAIASCNPSCVNGKCVMENETTRCECDQGFIGRLCNVVDVCVKNAVCDMFGQQAKCVVDEPSFITSSSVPYNATYKCQCPHPLNLEIVDCLALHLSTSVSRSISTALPSGMKSTAEMASLTSSSLNSDSIFSQRGTIDSMLVTTLSSLPKETAMNSFSFSTPMEPITTAHTSTTASQFFTTSESVLAASLHNVMRTNSTDTSPNSNVSTIRYSTRRTPPMGLETEKNELKTAALSQTIATESHTDATSLTTTKSGNFLTSYFTMYNSDRATSSPPHTPSLFIPQSTIPFWMGATAHPSDGHNEINEEGKQNEHKVMTDLYGQNSGDKRATKVSMTAVDEGGQQRTSIASWIVAVVALIALALLLLTTAVFVLRYVKRSRKLHGKYNPAREEYALSAAYSMPLSNISKEERLI